MSGEHRTVTSLAGPAARVLQVSLMKSGTHLIQELMVALGYGMYGSSRVTREIAPVFDVPTRHRIARLVYETEEYERVALAEGDEFSRATDQAWAALGWAWQHRLGMPLANRYGWEVINQSLVSQALRRTASVPFSETPAGVCWALTDLDVRKVDGSFLQEWSSTGEPRIIFMYRDPRDVVLSMVNFLSGKTAQGFGNYSDFLVYSRILADKPTLAEKLTYALSDRTFPCLGDHERALWLLHHPGVCKVSFEELVGEAGGGSAKAQLAAVGRVVEFLGADQDPARLVGKLFRRDSFSFYRGRIGAWRDVFTPLHEKLAERQFGEMISLYGYR